MSIAPIYTLTFIFVTILLTYFYTKRLESKGCITFTYVGIVLFCINFFLIISWSFFITSVKNVYDVALLGDNYTATVVRFIESESYDSDRRMNETMYQPVVEFTTKNGNVLQRKLDFSSSEAIEGKTYRINYNKEKDTVITLGFVLVLKFVAAFIFTLVFTFLFVGAINYVLGKEMDLYYHLLSIVGFYFFIPFLMIGFNLLLIYGAFYGNDLPLFVTGILWFFVFVLTLAIWGYFKMLQKGEVMPKKKRVHSSQLSRKKVNRKKKKKRKKK